MSRARCAACAGGEHDQCLAVDSPYPAAGTAACQCTDGACGGLDVELRPHRR